MKRLPEKRDHVTMDWNDRTLLGEVVEVYPYGDEEFRVRVKHFNGNPWPCEPLVSDVKVLDREAK